MDPAPPSERTAGLANVALLRRPSDLDEATWLRRWHIDHTPVASTAAFGADENIDTLPTSRYLFRSPFVSR